MSIDYLYDGYHQTSPCFFVLSHKDMVRELYNDLPLKIIDMIQSNNHVLQVLIMLALVYVQKPTLHVYMTTLVPGAGSSGIDK